MARRLAARPGAEPRCRTSCEDASTWSAARNRGSTPTYDRVEAAAGIALYAGLAAVPVRAGEARPRCPWAAAGPGRTSPSNTSAAGVEGAGGPGGHGRASGPGRGAGGRRQGQGGPRDRPLRAVRLACGDLAGGPPPTGTHSGPAPQPGPAGAPNTSGAPSNTTTGTTPTRPGIQKTDIRIGCRPVVELGGFEPPTFSLRTRRATNCAIAPRTQTA